MKRLFISQPMRGKTANEIMAVRYMAMAEAEKLIGESVEVIDSYLPDNPVDTKPLWCLGKSLQLMSEADVVYFAPGWREARGCQIEHLAAVEYGLDRIEEFK